MSEETRIVEISGVKLEVDLRSAKKVEKYRIGDYVRVLWKEYSSYNIFPGIIVGFEQFEKLPTIIIAAINPKYDSTDIKFFHLNAQATDTEIVKVEEADMSFDRDKILAMFDREIIKAEMGTQTLKDRREYFIRHFTKYVEVTEKKKKGIFGK